MGIGRYLAKREAFRVGPDGLHCEYYHYADDAPLIIFLPGIATYVELYAELLGRLSETGFNVVGVDPYGHGYSEGDRGVYTVESMVEGLQNVITALSGRSNGRVGVYGYSIGAMLAVALAEADQRIDAVLCGTLLLTERPPDMLHQLGWYWTWSTAQLFPSMSVPLRTFMDFDTLLEGHPAGEVINDDQRIVFDYPLSTLSNLFTHRAQVISKRYPFRAAVIQGDRDEILPLSYTRRVLEELEHPFELVLMPGEGHMIPWDNPKGLVSTAAHWFKDNLVHA